MKKADVIIIGSGIAALQLANKLAKKLNVMILTKKEITTGNSYMAQGGVAAAIDHNDDPFFHYLDTMEAGSHHNDASAVLEMTTAAPELIKGLWASGCSFDEDPNGQLMLGMEGAHSMKRIVHGGGDATGKQMIDFLASDLDYNVSIEESVFVYELITNEMNRCVGVKGKLRDGSIETYYAAHIVLATGGCGQLYSYTSNAETATGDGLALAYIAGAELADMEFIQFHPTLLYAKGRTQGLVSEAVRGEGAILVTVDGERIMEDVHPLKDLAPRHIVSQTIYDYLKNGRQIYLDISSVPDFSNRFPTISSLCEANGIEIHNGKIPVVPGSHFLMGGVRTDLYGRTSIEGLYAIGEVACTGIHGANRLASNSLLEGMFVGERLAELINISPPEEVWIEQLESPNNSWLEPGLDLPGAEVLKRTMMDRTGIVRTKEALMAQKEWLESLDLESLLNSDLGLLNENDIEKVFMFVTSFLITQSALERTESRGGHFREDFPKEDNANWLKRKIIIKRKHVKDGKHEYNQTALAT